MTLMEPQQEPNLSAAPAGSAPRIVNGLTVRPRKRENLWLWTLLVLPEIMAFAGWAALGFPSWRLVAAFGLLCLLGVGVLQWLVSRQT